MRLCAITFYWAVVLIAIYKPIICLVYTIEQVFQRSAFVVRFSVFISQNTSFEQSFKGHVLCVSISG
jgi:hypothetical protein